MYQTLYGLLLKIASDDRAEVMSGMNEVSATSERRETYSKHAGSILATIERSI